jgi:hypothetical protein
MPMIAAASTTIAHRRPVEVAPSGNCKTYRANRATRAMASTVVTRFREDRFLRAAGGLKVGSVVAVPHR